MEHEIIIKTDYSNPYNDKESATIIIIPDELLKLLKNLNKVLDGLIRKYALGTGE